MDSLRDFDIDYKAALEAELAAYESLGRTTRAAAVSDELARVSGGVPVPPADAGVETVVPVDDLEKAVEPKTRTRKPKPVDPETAEPS